MRLDTPTLFAVTVAATFMVGVLFLISYAQARGTRALAIWGCAHIVGAGASALLCLRGVIADSLSIGLGNAVMLAAYGVIWSGVRSFERRDPAYGLALCGGVLWLAACLVPDFYGSLPARVMLASTLGGLYCALAAYEIWRGRAQALTSRYAALAILSSYAFLYWIRVPLAVLAPLPSPADVMYSPWLAILCFAGILYSIAIAFVFMMMTMERAEREQRLAAESDMLTGIANRRAFVGRAQGHLAERAGPVALLLFDLDRFKAINDRYGHAVGDGVLIAFCHVAQAMLPREATLGRLGGEEFACVLPGLSAEEAAAVAERIRRALHDVTLAAYPRLAIRTSIGVVASGPGQSDVDSLLRLADEALYRAKRAGRDRVEIAQEQFLRAVA